MAADPYQIGGAQVPRLLVDTISRYLLDAPDGSEVDEDLHARLLAAGIVVALDAAGLEPVRKMGKAVWLWEPGLSMHVPCCQACGAALADDLIPEGLCRSHLSG